MTIYSYNNPSHKFKNLHDETGGVLKDFDFKYYDCFCGGSDYRVVATTTRHRNHFNVVQCSECGTLRINPYMSEASVERYYKEVYGRIKRENMDGAALFKHQSHNAARMLSALQPHMPEGTKVLDYGSGAGGRMAKIKEAGYDVYLHDHDQKYLDYGVQQGMKAYVPEMKYDMIILSHVLEHINHPVGFLKDYLAPMLSENGQIYIEVPYIENTKNRLLGDFHLAHKFYFTAESLTHLAAMAGLGKIADFRNAILVSKKQAIVPQSLPEALAKSNQHLAIAARKECVVKVKAAAKRLVSKGK